MRAFGEWEKQELIFLSLPHENTDWKPYLDEILDAYERLVAAIVPFQKVVLICPDERIFEERFAKFDNVEFVKIDTDDTWIRDYGMIDVEDFADADAGSNGKNSTSEGAACCERGGGENSSRRAKIVSYDFKFNAWGGKFESSKDNAVNLELAKRFKSDLRSIDLVLEGGSIDFNGCGTLLTTEKCLLNDNRNSHLNKEQIEARLKELFGLRRVIWLKNGFIKGDDTDSHVDTLARFIAQDTIAYASCDDPNDEHFEELAAMKKELESTGFKLVPLPLPKAKFYGGKRLGCTYANFIFINGAVIVPTYGDDNDKIVLERLAQELPNHKIIGVDSLVFVRQNGSLHCSSQNKYSGASEAKQVSSERSEAENKYSGASEA